MSAAAIDAILTERLRQVETFGHTAASDDALPLDHFARELSDSGRAILETVRFNKGDDILRRRLVRLGALVLATIDRVDRTPASTRNGETRND